MLNPNTYIHIEYWMTELGLSNVEVIIYAIIHGFSQDGKSCFSGSQKYFRQWTKKAKSTVIEALNNLKKHNLIVVKKVPVNNQFYNVYYTVESRKSPKERFSNIVIDPKAKIKLDVDELTESENQTGPKTGPIKSENQTSEVQNSDQQGPKIGHNNIADIALKNAADSSNNSDECIDSAIKAIISQKVTDLFGSLKMFDAKFIEKIEESILETSLSEEQIEPYIQFAFEKTCSKKPDSIPCLFRKMACAKDVVQDFILKNPKKIETPVKYILCPSCGIEFKESENYCPTCGLTVVAIKNNNIQEIKIHRTLHEMNDEQRQKFDEEYEKWAKQRGRRFLTQAEKYSLMVTLSFIQEKIEGGK